MKRPEGMDYEEYRRQLKEYNKASRRRATHGIMLANDDRTPATRAEIQRRQVELVKKHREAQAAEHRRKARKLLP